MWLMKDARLSLPLTEVMKIARLTSPLLDVLCQSSPRPRLRHGRRLALLFHLNLTLNLYTLFFPLSLSLLPHLCSSPRELALVYAAYLRSHFSVSQAKVLCNRARGYLSKLCRATCPEECHSSFCSPFIPTEFLVTAFNLCRPLHCHWPRQCRLFHAKAPFSLRHGFSSSHLQSLLHFAFLSFHLEDIYFSYP